MKRFTFPFPVAAAVLCAALPFLPGGACAREAKHRRAAVPAPGTVMLWGTVKHSNESLASDALEKKDGWKEVIGGDIPGDACLANTYLCLVVRKGHKGGELYYKLGGKFVKGAELVPVGDGGDKCKGIESFKAIEQYKDKAVLEITYATRSGKKISALHVLQKDRPIVEIRPGAGMEEVSVEGIESKYAVLPDFYGNDLVVNAERTPAAQLNFPSENMVLQLTDNGNAIVMGVFRSGEQRVRMTLGGTGRGRAIRGMEIDCSKEKALDVCVAILAAPGIWRQEKIGELDRIKDTKLDWKVPFRAERRVDFRREVDGLIDSWIMAVERGDGQWRAGPISLRGSGRTYWSSTRGTFAYPAMIDDQGNAFLKNWEFEPHFQLRGVIAKEHMNYRADDYAVIYPFEGAEEAAPRIYTVLDVLRVALEETPEHSVWKKLKPERRPEDAFPATCDVTEYCEEMLDANKEKQERRRMLEELRRMYFFVLVMRECAESYRQWLKKMQDFCARERAAKPKIAGLIDEMENHALRIEKAYQGTLPRMQTPPVALEFVEEIVALIDGSQKNKGESSQELGRKIRTIGGAQDSTIGCLHKVLKELRQKAGYRMIEAKDADSFKFAREVRRRTLDMLSGYFSHEGLD